MELTRLPNIGSGIRESQLTPERRAELRVFWDDMPK